MKGVAIYILITILALSISQLSASMCLESENNVAEITSTHAVPEYSATDMYMHRLAQEFNINPYNLNAAASTVGYGHRGYENLNYLYVRDYFPLQVKAVRDGALKSFFIKYPSIIHGGREFNFLSPHNRMNKPSESSEFLTYDAGGSKMEFWAETKSLPLILEGGNIIQTPTTVFIGKKIIDVNGKSEADLIQVITNGNQKLEKKAKAIVAAAKAVGWKSRSEKEILELIAKVYETKVENIVALEPMPFEQTFHIDMFMSLIKPGTIALPVISQKAIEARPEIAAESKTINEWLEKQSEVLSKEGYQIERFPMLPPEISQAAGSASKVGDFYTPVNWIMNGKKILVPDFPAAAKKYPDSVYAEIKAEVTKKLENFGYEPNFIDVSSLVKTKGSLHCISAQYDLSEYRDNGS
ncbi:agmatine deiminase family protein [Oligoflexaceae bacterium]|nr:agmatine deiminase family protein [Oligoflexaceae bacterium]